MVRDVLRSPSKKPKASAGRACGIQSHSQDEPEWGGLKKFASYLQCDKENIDARDQERQTAASAV
jgi:hypothetical protein